MNMGVLIIIKTKKITWQFTGLIFIKLNFANKTSFFIILPTDLRLQEVFDQLLVRRAKSEPAWQIQRQHSHNITHTHTEEGLSEKPRKALVRKYM